MLQYEHSKVRTNSASIFGKSCLNIQIIGNDGKFHTPREWFIAPLEVINKLFYDCKW